MVKLNTNEPNESPCWTPFDESKLKHQYDSDDGNSYDDKSNGRSWGTLLATVSKIESLCAVLKAFTKSSLMRAWHGEAEERKAQTVCTTASASPRTLTPKCREPAQAASIPWLNGWQS